MARSCRELSELLAEIVPIRPTSLVKRNGFELPGHDPLLPATKPGRLDINHFAGTGCDLLRGRQANVWQCMQICKTGYFAPNLMPNGLYLA